MALRHQPSRVAHLFNDIKEQMPLPGGGAKPSGHVVPNLARNAAVAISEQEKAQGLPRRRSFASPKLPR